MSVCLYVRMYGRYLGEVIVEAVIFTTTDIVQARNLVCLQDTLPPVFPEFGLLNIL